MAASAAARWSTIVGLKPFVKRTRYSPGTASGASTRDGFDADHADETPRVTVAEMKSATESARIRCRVPTVASGDADEVPKTVAAPLLRGGSWMSRATVWLEMCLLA